MTALTPESARDLVNALARLDGGQDQRDLWQLRSEAESKMVLP